MQYNQDPKFVGISVIQKKQQETLRMFQRAASARNWAEIHGSHYDWWMFPIDEPSKFGFAYTVYEGDVCELKKNADFINSYQQGAELLAFAWGWDLPKAIPVPNPDPDQCWQDWPIRLYKATKSLQLFGLETHFQSFRKYGQLLLSKGIPFEWSRDITWIFR